MKLSYISIAITLAFFTSMAADANASSDEPELSLMFRGGPAHSGVYTSKGPENMRHIKWRFKTGGKVRASPAVTAQVVCVGSEDGYLYALERTIGKVVWKFFTHGEVSGSPAIDGDLVVFPGGDRHLYGLSLETGSPLWRVETGPALDYDFLGGDPRNFEGSSRRWIRKRAWKNGGTMPKRGSFPRPALLMAESTSATGRAV